MFNGVDIVKIERIKKSAENERFLKRVFGPEELEIYSSRGKPAQFLAGNFAAKEAFSKAIGTGFRGFWFSDVQILRDNFGRPYFKFSENVSEIIKERKLSLSVSISHEKEYAIAFVIATNI